MYFITEVPLVHSVLVYCLEGIVYLLSVLKATDALSSTNASLFKVTGHSLPIVGWSS